METPTSGHRSISSLSVTSIDPYIVCTPLRVSYRYCRRKSRSHSRFPSFLHNEDNDFNEIISMNGMTNETNTNQISVSSQTSTVIMRDSNNNNHSTLNYQRSNWDLPHNSSNNNIINGGLNNVSMDYGTIKSRIRDNSESSLTIHRHRSTVHSELSLSRKQDFPSKEVVVNTVMEGVKPFRIPSPAIQEDLGTDDEIVSSPEVTSLSNARMTTDTDSATTSRVVFLHPKADGKLHRPSFYKRMIDKPVVSRSIMICFTSGLISSVVGIVSLKEPSFINNHLPFRVFYPTGTLLMLTIVFLKFPRNRFVNQRTKYTALITMFILPVLITALILKFDLSAHSDSLLSYHSPSPSSLSTPSLSPFVFMSMFLFAIQLVISFGYVLFCLQDMTYL